LIDDPSPLRFFYSIGAPSAEEILDRYIEALGGAEHVESVTSIVATGTYAGFDTLNREVPLEMYAESPNRRTLVGHWGAGPVPVQIDYSDYRDVAGVQMPFHQVVTWTNGRSVMDLSEIRANVPIDDARFGRPEPAALPDQPVT
jgi:hypothetical protein